MNQNLGLRILGEVMQWDNDEAHKEYSWLRLMARLKYDGYSDFLAGMRFIESFITWLQQFKEGDDRKAAYDFIRHKLVYIGIGEMEQLVRLFYPSTVYEQLLRTVAKDCGVPTYRVLSEHKAAIERLRRQTLFMGLSDGARIDVLRHHNAGVLTNEQIVVATQIDTDKWSDMLKELRDDQEDDAARFKLVYLIDDFMGTGTSFLRENEEKNKWSGKLARFMASIKNCDDIFADKWQLCVHHYIATYKADQEIRARCEEWEQEQGEDGYSKRASSVVFTFGMVLPENLPIDKNQKADNSFIKLTDAYYNPSIETRHTKVGGKEHIGFGYGGCALPLVLEHNTPNNSIALLWAEAQADQGSKLMRPLFRRQQRHS